MAAQDQQSATEVATSGLKSSTEVENGNRGSQRDVKFAEALRATRAKAAGQSSQMPRRILAPRQVALAKHAFLEHYGKYGNIGYCCELAGIGRATFYRWQEHDADFAMAFQQAEKRALETLEQEAWRRAVEGSPYTRTSYYRGEPVGTDHKIEYSDQLLTLLLRAKAPERYREKMDLAVSQVIKTVAGVEPSTVL